MDPYGFQFRSKAHLIAIADIVLSGISFGWSLIFLLAAFAISEASKNPQLKKGIEKQLEQDEGGGEEVKIPEISSVFVAWFWLNAICLFVISILEIVVAVKLLNSTEPGKEPIKALKWTKLWRSVNGGFLVIIVFNLLFCSSDRGFFGCLFVLINIGIRGAALFYVHKFVKELEGYTQCGSTLPTSGSAGAGMYQSDGGDMMGKGGPASYEY